MDLEGWDGGFWGALCALVLASCAPPIIGPDAVVQGIYRITAQKMGHELTNVADIPMTDELAGLIRDGAAAAERNDEPFIDGDLAANCQDCTAIADITTILTTPPANGRAVVEAHFKLDGAPSVVIWDMAQTPQGWRVDNIRAPDGYNLRTSIAQDAQAASCADERGAQAAASLVAQCLDVSPATHPPCNSANACAMIEAEIARGCAMVTGADRPAFCPTPH